MRSNHYRFGFEIVFHQFGKIHMQVGKIRIFLAGFHEFHAAVDIAQRLDKILGSTFFKSFDQMR